MVPMQVRVALSISVLVKLIVPPVRAISPPAAVPATLLLRTETVPPATDRLAPLVPLLVAKVLLATVRVPLAWWIAPPVPVAVLLVKVPLPTVTVPPSL